MVTRANVQAVERGVVVNGLPILIRPSPLYPEIDRYYSDCVIGGIGSVKGALVGALLIGFVDTFGKGAEVSIGGLRVLPDLAGMSIYVLMAVVLLWRPEGIFGRRLR